MPPRIGRIAETPASAWTPTIKAELFAGRREAPLAKAVGLTQFGVNHLTLAPSSISSLRHWHEGEDEFVLVLSGEVALVDGDGEHALSPGDYAGFPAGEANGHHLVNRGTAQAVCIVVGTRKVGEETIHYPDDGIGPFTVVRDARGERT